MIRHLGGIDPVINPARQGIRRHLDEQWRFALVADDEHSLRPEEGPLSSLTPFADFAGDRQMHRYSAILNVSVSPGLRLRATDDPPILG